MKREKKIEGIVCPKCGRPMDVYRTSKTERGVRRVRRCRPCKKFRVTEEK